jgi:hypothetical protein
MGEFCKLHFKTAYEAMGKTPPAKKAWNPNWGKNKCPIPGGLMTASLLRTRHGVIGVDEAGRGCLAGPVVAGCVIIPAPFFRSAKNRKKTQQINDSKQFSETQREVLFGVIENLAKERAIFAGTGHASIEEIEEFNIVGATCLAMRRAMDEASSLSKNLWSPELKEVEGLFNQFKGFIHSLAGFGGWKRYETVTLPPPRNSEGRYAFPFHSHGFLVGESHQGSIDASASFQISPI